MSDDKDTRPGNLLSFVKSLFAPEAPSAPPITSEASINLERHDVAPFLTRLANNPIFGLPHGFVETIMRVVPGLAHGQSHRWSIDGAFNGRPMRMEIEAFVGEPDAVDITILCSRDVVAEIDREMDIYLT